MIHGSNRLALLASLLLATACREDRTSPLASAAPSVSAVVTASGTTAVALTPAPSAPSVEVPAPPSAAAPSASARSNQTPLELDRVAALISVPPYVEQRCAPAEFAGWPFPAKACSYTQKKQDFHVVVADPEPSRVAAWIDDAASEIPRLAALRASAPGDYERGLGAIARFVSGQSSRIFPLEGDIWEDMAGDGIGKSYPFDRGVSVRSGRCRLTSINFVDWCAYAASRPGATEKRTACEERLADVGAFAAVCLDVHVRAWNAPTNEGFHAMTRLANAELEKRLQGREDVDADRLLEELGHSLGSHAHSVRGR